MGFGIGKCAMMIMKKGKKKETSEGIELSNQESIRTLAKKRRQQILEII